MFDKEYVYSNESILFYATAFMQSIIRTELTTPAFEHVVAINDKWYVTSSEIIINVFL